MIQIAICDDEPLLLEEIEKQTRECLHTRKVFSVISTYTRGENLLFDLEDGISFDLFLLDIELPGLSGMELARKIHQLLPQSLVLFVTAHYKYAVDAYELNIFRYIPKNQLKERLPHALADAAAVLEIQNTDSYLISNQNRMERIPLKSVQYIMRDGKNAVFHLSGGNADTSASSGALREYRVRRALSELYGELNQSYFVFIDRGCIVNLYHICKISGSDCELADGTVLAIAQSRIVELKRKLNEFWRDKI